MTTIPHRRAIDDILIWGLYDRNSRYYHTCRDLAACPTRIDGYAGVECLCHHDQIVRPQDIGEWWQPPKPARKCYIEIGADCPICLSAIQHKRNAWLTVCGHAFHRTCLMTYYNTYMETVKPYGNCVPCPICREELPTCCAGFEMGRYVGNELDGLENFTQLCDLMLPAKCYKCDRDEGMNRTCAACIDYRQNGNIY